MKQVIKNILYPALLAGTMTACDKLPENGDLDGQWQLTEIHDRQENVESDHSRCNVREQRIYWNFQLRMLQICSPEGQYNAYFSHREGRLVIPEIYRKEQNNDIPLADPATTELEYTGIRGNTADFKVNRLGKRQMILTSETDSLVFRKIAL